jgi:hypothetical protein
VDAIPDPDYAPYNIVNLTQSGTTITGSYPLPPDIATGAGAVTGSLRAAAPQVSLQFVINDTILGRIVETFNGTLSADFNSMTGPYSTTIPGFGTFTGTGTLVRQ